MKAHSAGLLRWEEHPKERTSKDAAIYSQICPFSCHPEGCPVGTGSFLPFQRRSVLLVIIVIIRVGLSGVLVVISLILTEALLGCQLGGLLLLLPGKNNSVPMPAL